VIVLVKKISASWWVNNRTTLITLLRVAFGFVWLLNGLMKIFWLGPDDITNMVQQASQGQPVWLQPWFSFWTSIISSNPAFMLYGIRVSELTLAFTLLLGFMRKLSYLSGILLSLIIWTVAEGFGGPYGPGSTDIGAAILYPFVFFALIVLETRADSNRYTLDKLMEQHIEGWGKIAETSNLHN
jgi:nitrite reductase (NO-forming)